jgi:hypothetical protein
MVYSGTLCRVALVRTDVSEELTRVTRRNVPEDAILHNFDTMAHFKITYENYSQRNEDDGEEPKLRQRSQGGNLKIHSCNVLHLTVTSECSLLMA